jgi:hypothetical protein
MNIDKLFPTKDEREQTISSLKTLLNSKGWKVLKKLLDSDLEKLDNELKFREFEDLEEQKRTRDRYADLLLLCNYPEDIIKDLSDSGEPDIPNFDPYTDIKDVEGSSTAGEC